MCGNCPRALRDVLPHPGGAPRRGSQALREGHTCFWFSEPPFRQEERLVCDNCVTQGKALTRPGPVSLLDEEAGPQRLFRPPELPNSHPEVAEFKLFFFFF